MLIILPKLHSEIFQDFLYYALQCSHYALIFLQQLSWNILISECSIRVFNYKARDAVSTDCSIRECRSTFMELKFQFEISQHCAGIALQVITMGYLIQTWASGEAPRTGSAFCANPPVPNW